MHIVVPHNGVYFTCNGTVNHQLESKVNATQQPYYSLCLYDYVFILHYALLDAEIPTSKENLKISDNVDHNLNSIPFTVKPFAS